jgi:chromosome segregation ATPase
MLTLGQAAKESNVSKSTLSRAIKEGRMSATRREDGGYMIDPAELFRAYPKKQSATDAETVSWSGTQPVQHSNINGLQMEVEMLRERLQDKDSHIDTLQQQVGDIQKDRDHWRQQATHLLEHKQSADTSTEGHRNAVEAHKGFFGMFSRRRA